MDDPRIFLYSVCARVFNLLEFRLIYMVLVRYLAGIIVWLSILFYFVALIILGVYCYTESKEYEENGK
jgi:hypothetical protein